MRSRAALGGAVVPGSSVLRGSSGCSLHRQVCLLRSPIEVDRPRLPAYPRRKPVKIAVLGTGIVGRTIAARFAALGHEVAVGTRDPQATLARTEPDAMGNPPFSAWHAEHPQVSPRHLRRGRRSRPSSSSTRPAGGVSIAVLNAAGAENLAGKVAARHRQPAGLLPGLPALPVRQGHRLPGRADPARVPRRPGGQDAQHHDRRAHGRARARRRRRPLRLRVGQRRRREEVGRRRC